MSSSSASLGKRKRQNKNVKTVSKKNKKTTSKTKITKKPIFRESDESGGETKKEEENEKKKTLNADELKILLDVVADLKPAASKKPWKTIFKDARLKGLVSTYTQQKLQDVWYYKKREKEKF